MDNNSKTYNDFIEQNAKTINKLMALPILASLLIGPLCALLKFLKVFEVMSYASCFICMGLSAVVFGIHFAMVKSNNDSRNTAMIIMVLLEAIIVYMRAVGFNVSVAAFIVPMLSLLYCNKKMYLTISAVCFAGLLIGMFLSRGHWGE